MVAWLADRLNMALAGKPIRDADEVLVAACSLLKRGEILNGLRAEPSPPSAAPLEHGMNCRGTTPGNEAECTCGLHWRIQLQTEREMHNAWRKRAEEAEQKLAEPSTPSAAPKERDYVAAFDELYGCDRDLYAKDEPAAPQPTQNAPLWHFIEALDLMCYHGSPEEWKAAIFKFNRCLPASFRAERVAPEPAPAHMEVVKCVTCGRKVVVHPANQYAICTHADCRAVFKQLTAMKVFPSNS